MGHTHNDQFLVFYDEMTKTRPLNLGTIHKLRHHLKGGHQIRTRGPGRDVCQMITMHKPKNTFHIGGFHKLRLQIILRIYDLPSRPIR